MTTSRFKVTISTEIEWEEATEGVVRAALIQLAKDLLSVDEDVERAITTYGWEVTTERIPEEQGRPLWEQQGLWGDPVPMGSEITFEPGAHVYRSSGPGIESLIDNLITTTKGQS